MAETSPSAKRRRCDPPRIGVLCVQGGFAEHMDMLRRVGAEAIDVRTPQDLQQCDGLIIPGGESTTIGLVARGSGLIEAMRAFIGQGRPVWGTCAGLIVLCDCVHGQQQGGQALIGGLKCECKRNGFGRQVNSFEQTLDIAPDAGLPVQPTGEAIFIRAPAVSRVDCDTVKVLATVQHKLTGDAAEHPVIVAVRQGPILATSFHPELTEDSAWHAFFRSIVEEHKAKEAAPAS
eukprot:TRINITY_DN19611_c0_g1_i1.p1 TRINITY_DN19611_c0_g1~~TRINITY_DN19611_c0_g1_i1.p1  ORF type:complete len:261 (+),score=57.49 TRINITY_DN19611_c0_g1_i1:85-783(+)